MAKPRLPFYSILLCCTIFLSRVERLRSRPHRHVHFLHRRHDHQSRNFVNNVIVPFITHQGVKSKNQSKDVYFYARKSTQQLFQSTRKNKSVGSHPQTLKFIQNMEIPSMLPFLPSRSTASNPPPLPITNNPYLILGLHDPYYTPRFNKEATIIFPTIDEIKRAYHRLVRFYHPDSKQHGGSNGPSLYNKSVKEREADFEKLNEAYMKLMSTGGKYNERSQTNAKILRNRAYWQQTSRQTPSASNSTAIIRLQDMSSFICNACDDGLSKALLVISNVEVHEGKWNQNEVLQQVLRYETEKHDDKTVKVKCDPSITLIIQKHINKTKVPH